jgi:hypothetical protein
MRRTTVRVAQVHESFNCLTALLSYAAPLLNYTQQKSNFASLHTNVATPHQLLIFYTIDHFLEKCSSKLFQAESKKFPTKLLSILFSVSRSAFSLEIF